VIKTAIFTTYLAYLKKFDYNPLKIFPTGLESTLIYYVMRDRGNNEVAPTGTLLYAVKKEGLSWDGYCHSYKEILKDAGAQEWMRKRADESKAGHHVILVCFEKDPEHCHRRLLAETIATQFGAEYKGELSNYQ
jgi:uncharacterized protein YeaO (DUF488 family)